MPLTCRYHAYLMFTLLRCFCRRAAPYFLPLYTPPFPLIDLYRAIGIDYAISDATVVILPLFYDEIFRCRYIYRQH